MAYNETILTNDDLKTLLPPSGAEVIDRPTPNPRRPRWHHVPRRRRGRTPRQRRT